MTVCVFSMLTSRAPLGPLVLLLLLFISQPNCGCTYIGQLESILFLVFVFMFSLSAFVFIHTFFLRVCLCFLCCNNSAHATYVMPEQKQKEMVFVSASFSSHLYYDYHSVRFALEPKSCPSADGFRQAAQENEKRPCER